MEFKDINIYTTAHYGNNSRNLTVKPTIKFNSTLDDVRDLMSPSNQMTTIGSPILVTSGGVYTPPNPSLGDISPTNHLIPVTFNEKVELNVRPSNE